MKNVVLILSILLLASCTGSKQGIKVSGFHDANNSYWLNQSHKIVHRNQRYARMEKRAANKEDRMTKNILAAKAKEKKKDKKYLATTFDFH